jgi:branched-chain amino acid aminotransferase
MKYVFHQRNLLPEEEVSISADAHGLLFGVGLFASILGLEGRAFAVEHHYERFSEGAKRLGLQAPTEAVFREAAEAVLTKNNFDQGEARVRAWLGAGAAGESIFHVTAGPLPPHPPYAQIAVVPWRRNTHGALTGVKSSSYAENILARNWATAAGHTEAIFLNTEGKLCEGATSNLFWITKVSGEPVLRTPAVESGCLPGVTRQLVLGLAETHGLAAEVGLWEPTELANASEIFLTSSYRRIQPVHMLEGKPLSNLKDTTEHLQQWFRGLEQHYIRFC